MVSPQPWTLVLACDEGYALPTAVCLKSIEQHLTDAPVEVQVLTPGLSAAAADVVREACSFAPVVIIQEHVPTVAYAADRTAAHVSPTMLLKWQATTYAPPHVTRTVYLDSDTVVEGDLSRLAAADLRGRPIGAVRDRYVRPGVTAPYFNSGVFVADTRRWNVEQWPTRLRDVAERTPLLRFPDQDVLNLSFDGAVAYLPTMWNTMVGEDVKARNRRRDGQAFARASVLHFVGPTKPWKERLSCHLLQSTYDAHLAALGESIGVSL